MNRRRFLATASTGIGAATWFEPFAPAQTVGSVEGLELDNIYPKAEDGATSTAIFYRAKGTNPKAAIILMHPRADFTRWQLSGYLGKAGIGMLGCASRYVNNDTDCLTENVLLDIAAGIQQIKERYGIQRVIGYGHIARRRRPANIRPSFSCAFVPLRPNGPIASIRKQNR